MQARGRRPRKWGVGARGGRARQLPLPGAAREGGRCPHPGEAGVVRRRAPGGLARVAPEPGHLRSVRAPLRNGKQDSVRDSSCTSGSPGGESDPPAVGCSSAWGHCQILPGIGRAGGARSGRASVTNAREKDLGPKGKIEGVRRSESERRAHPGPRQDHGIRGRQARINSQVVKFEMQKLWLRFQLKKGERQ